MEGDTLRDECGHVADAGHETGDHCPGEVAAVKGAWLANDGPDTLCLYDAPNEERYPRGRRDDGLDREKVAAADRISRVRSGSKASSD